MSSNHRLRPREATESAAAGSVVVEEILKAERIQIERKTFVFTLRENPRGRFLRITEDVGGRRDNIIIPAPGLNEFRRVIDEMAKHSDETPPKRPND